VKKNPRCLEVAETMNDLRDEENNVASDLIYN
jgi:hypothetical protein